MPVERIVKPYDETAKFCALSPSTVIRMGDITEITAYMEEPKPPPCKRLDADTYEDLRTGDIKEYQHTGNRAQWQQGIKRTLRNVRAIINSNVTDVSRIRWVTLTYSENMTDTARLYHDFQDFWKRFCRYCEKHSLGKPEYISVIEPQGRGAWHIHALFLWDGPAPFIDNNSVLWRLWGHGYTKIKAVSANVDNFGAYFSAYLADMDLNELGTLSDDDKAKALSKGCEIVEKESIVDGVKRKKRIVKGGRLHMYPSGMQIIRYSKGVKKPEVEKMPLGDAKKEVRAATLTFSRSYVIEETDNETNNAKMVNIVRKEYYNRKRMVSQAEKTEKS